MALQPLKLAQVLTERFRGTPEKGLNRCSVNMDPSADVLVNAGSKDPSIVRKALRSYAEAITRRTFKSSPKDKQRDYFPPVTKPDAYKSASDKIRIPHTISKELVAKIDLNRDGYMHRFQERKQAWIAMRNCYTRLHVLKSLAASGCTSMLVSRAIKRLESDIKALRPLYRYLPQVDSQKQTVSVYGSMFSIKSVVGRTHPTTLFGLGEGLMNYHYSVFKRYNIARLKFRVTHLRSAGEFVSPATINVQYRKIEPGVFRLFLAYGRFRPYMSAMRLLALHEVGHYVDYTLGRRLGFGESYLSGSDKLYWKWKTRIRRALPRKRGRDYLATLERGISNPWANKRVRTMQRSLIKQFLTLYSTKNPGEWLAEAWTFYWGGGRAAVAKRAPSLYRLFEKIRKGEDLAYYSKCSQLVRRKKLYRKMALRKWLLPRIWEISLSSSGSFISTKPFNLGVAIKYYHLRGALFAKLALGYREEGISGEDKRLDRGYASAGYGVHLGSNLEGIFRGGSLDASAGVFIPTWKPFFNAELQFPKLRIYTSGIKHNSLEISPMLGVHVYSGDNKRVVVEPYLGLSLGFVF